MEAEEDVEEEQEHEQHAEGTVRKPKRIVAFTSKQSLKCLGKTPALKTSLDGAFSSAPPPFKQVFVWMCKLPSGYWILAR